MGIGKMVGNLVGQIPVLKKLAPAISLVTNLATGNFAAAALDVVGLVAKFAPANSFIGRMASFAPLASSFMSGGGFKGVGNLLTGKLNTFASNFKNVVSNFELGLNVVKSGDLVNGGVKIFKAFDTAKQFMDDANQVRAQIRNAYQLGTGFRG